MPAADIDWQQIRRVLIVKLRSIGDTVLATPSIAAIRRHAPNAQIDILLEDRIAPVLDGLELVDEVLRVGDGTLDRLKTALELRRRGYDIAFNLHGGTTATFFTAASRARHRLGLGSYQYSFLYTDLLTSAADFWGRSPLHSVEQQLALVGFAGVPVDRLPPSELAVTSEAAASIAARLEQAGLGEQSIALIHPASAFATKSWAAANFARVAEHLRARGITPVAVASTAERPVLDELNRHLETPITTFHDLSLPEISALAARSSIFVGNDSGIAHIASAHGVPVVVIFGSSNRDHWRPWTQAPSEMVFEPFECQPCAGYECAVFGEPRCILSVSVPSVIGAVDRVLERAESKK